MTTVLAPPDLYEEWPTSAPTRLKPEAPAPAAAAAAEALAEDGLHVHLVSGDVQCLTHDCLALPGT